MSPRRGLNLRVILEVAAEIANQEGVEAITLAKVAKKLQIRPPSLYNHVNGLPGLLYNLEIYGTKLLLEELTKAAVGRAGDDAVFALADAYVSFARKHPGLYEATLHSPGVDDIERQRVGESILELLVNVLQAYNLNGDSSLHVVRGLRSILHGFASLEQKGGFGMKSLDLNESLRLLIETFLAGIHQIQRDISDNK